MASAPELPVGVRLIFQPAEELMPGGAIDAIAAGVLSGFRGFSRCTAIPGWRSAKWR
ncbi:N-acyl-L-amino acid amidohydrolase AmiA1 domain protein [Mycobacterium xenopi 3993]|nr:N-acyl-L-amino acid amidohydrolase AmiA1 domain protein [Mycobacterium xenopi 3993]